MQPHRVPPEPERGLFPAPQLLSRPKSLAEPAPCPKEHRHTIPAQFQAFLEELSQAGREDELPIRVLAKPPRAQDPGSDKEAAKLLPRGPGTCRSPQAVPAVISASRAISPTIQTKIVLCLSFRTVYLIE